MTTLRLCALALVLVALQGTFCAPVCDKEKDPKCERMTDIGDAYAWGTLSGRRFLLQTHRRPGAQFQNMAPHLANRRSLLAPMCSETSNKPEDVVSCTNAVRQSPGSFAGDMRCGGVSSRGGLGPLRMDSKLSQAAIKHANDNARMGDLTHTGSDGSSVSTRVKRAGYDYRMVRENIAWGYDSAKEVVMGWMCSSGHRDNIMSCDVNDIGVGIAMGRDNRPYHAQVFGCSSGDSCGCGGSDRSDDDIPSSGSPSSDQPSGPRDSEGGSEGGSDRGSGFDPRFKDFYKGGGDHGFQPRSEGGDHGFQPRSEGGDHGFQPRSEGGDHGFQPKPEGFGGETPYSGPYRRRYRRYRPSGGHRTGHGPSQRGDGEGKEHYKKFYKHDPKHQMYGDRKDSFSFGSEAGEHDGYYGK